MRSRSRRPHSRRSRPSITTGPYGKDFPEVIHASGKTVEQVMAIAGQLEPHGDGVLITRCDPALREALGDKYAAAEVNELGRTVYVPPTDPSRVPKGKGTVLIVTAGTSDLPVAEEAAATSKALGDTVSSGRLTSASPAFTAFSRTAAIS